MATVGDGNNSGGVGKYKYHLGGFPAMPILAISVW